MSERQNLEADLRARLERAEKERDEAREEVIGLRGASSGAIEILTEQNDELRARVATLEKAGSSVLDAYSVDVFRTLSASSKLALAVIELADALAGVRALGGE